MPAPLDEPSAEDWAYAAALTAKAERCGVGVALLAAMVLRRLGCRMTRLRREDQRVSAARSMAREA